MENIRDLHDAEKQLTRSLPRLAKAPSHPELQAAFTDRVKQTKGQVARLESVFEKLGGKAKNKPCAAMKGLIEEGQQQMQVGAEDGLMDLMLIGACQKVEHYEISGYGTVRTLAEIVGYREVADSLWQTKEESRADERLTGIAAKILQEVQQ